MAKLFPDNHPAGKFQFDVFISAGGGRFVPDGEDTVTRCHTAAHTVHTLDQYILIGLHP